MLGPFPPPFNLPIQYLCERRHRRQTQYPRWNPTNAAPQAAGAGLQLEVTLHGITASFGF